MLDTTTIQAWREPLRGRLFAPEDAGYDEARRVFNGMIDSRPAAIVRCAGVADVMAAVGFAREADLPVAVRGGGHGVTGSAVGEGSLVVDLSAMQSVHVDPERRTARAEGGATWGGFDHETQAFGLATTGGIVPSTGIAGLTLGGGIGYLNRKYGLACDNLLSADVVTAEGKLVTASADEHPDLFWGLRGGGGNFGVVTSLEYRLHPVGPVLAGELVFPLDRAKEVLRRYRDWSSAAPDELRADATLLSGPEGPVLDIIVCWCGELEEGEKVVQPLRSMGAPLLDSVAPVPYAVVQNRLAEVFRPGLRHYWKAGFMRTFSDAAIDAMVDAFTDDLPAPLAAIAIEHLGGEIGRVGSQDTAFAYRHAQHSVLVLRMWHDPADSGANIAWGRRCFHAAAPFLEEGAYVNYLGDEGEAKVRSAFGANYQRLAALKRRYDPTNLFRFNQNIPAVPG
ncbi:FAD-binding oxidoreductase [Halomonas koreensis]|uniref:FAD-binding oxidoreductase n=1 Tax=Halomonas koreensis TaxID=245385 RepID=A0ABU1G135_9GAMM|nr:FAD-binding oxidoreductase [Halomonas koreensis]MDR5866149.1 FAD-binding oxidoreductase [Halomonas koreensis]